MNSITLVFQPVTEFMRMTCVLGLLSLSGLSAQAAVSPETSPVPAERSDAAQPLGDRSYCQERHLGYWFYCTKPKPKTVPIAPPPPSASLPTSTYKQKLTEIREHLDELQARAIMEPTESNVLAYHHYQAQQIERASEMSDQWRRVIWKHPEEDYTLFRPTGTVSKQIWVSDRHNAENKTLAALNERYGIFYFYGGACTACAAFSPILKSFTELHGIKVVAVSVDGGANISFPEAIPDRGQRQRMGLDTTVPALVLFDVQTKQVKPIGYGILSQDELSERIYVLTQQEVGKDY